MLSERETARIEALVPNYETRSAVAVEALRIVQEERGWVSDEALQDLAAFLQVSAEQLEGLASFYSLVFRRPVGRHIILVCGSVCCWMQGADEVREWLEGRLGIGLGETSADGRFTLLPAVCLGACEQAPAILVDWKLYGRLTPSGLESILAAHP